MAETPDKPKLDWLTNLKVAPEQTEKPVVNQQPTPNPELLGKIDWLTDLKVNNDLKPSGAEASVSKPASTPPPTLKK